MPVTVGTPTQPISDIVIVDDDEIALEYFVRLLRRTSWRCRTYSDPERALDELLNEPTVLLLVDHRMPMMDGIDLFERLGESSALARGGNWLCTAVSPPKEIASRASALGIEVLVKDRLNDRPATLTMLGERLSANNTPPPA